MIHDKARIFAQAGRGGDGCLSFRREAHVPRGGPDGGDGGRGGDILLVCDGSLRDLQSLAGQTEMKAGRGGHGEGALRSGAGGGSLEIHVPPGTVAELSDGAIHDLVVPGATAVVARGGSGGRGNNHFKSSTRQTPRFSERGLPGEEFWIDLRLKLLADVGLVGVPNAGKSSLISALTRAVAKVGDYPFTTLEPQLGVLDRGGRQLVLADIPGLIEGASSGAGLGHEFLAHVERTRLLVHVLDLAPLDGSDPEANYELIESELSRYNAELAALPRVVALSKADLVTAEDAAAVGERWRTRLGADVVVVVTSSATREGLDSLADALVQRVPVEAAAPQLAPSETLAEHQIFKPAAAHEWRVEELEGGGYLVSGDPVEKLLARYDVENDEALAQVEQRLRRMGVIDALVAAGFEAGDDVEIGGVSFELDPA
jgi:GTP-binding protein